MARDAQPGLIVVERSCPGKHENYQTPEQTIPATQLTNPWESCITLTHDWGWTPRQVFKTPAKVISILSEIVAKGGSLLLGVGPSPEGIIAEDVIARLDEIGAWMKANGEAIYATVTTPVYTNTEQNIWFTAAKDGKTIYGIVPQKDDTAFPEFIEWEGNAPRKGSKIITLDGRKSLKWINTEGKTKVWLPKNVNGSNGIAIKFVTI